MKKTTFYVFAIISMLLVLISAGSCIKDDDENNFVNGTDSAFLIKAAYSNYAEINAGNIASTKGNSDLVRMFGTMMVADHSKAQTSLDSINTLFMLSLPVTPDNVHISKAAYLQTLSGYNFDTAYMNAQVSDHQVTIAFFQKEISSGIDRFIKDYATSHLPIIQTHLQEALDIQAQLK